MNIDKAIVTWHKRLDRVTKKVKDEFGELDSEKLNWKPSTEKWSIAEVLEHLVLVNQSYEIVLTDAANGTSNPGFTSKIPFIVEMLGNAIYKSVEPTRSKKIKTFPVWQPTSSNVDKNILTRFFDYQEILKHLISKNKELLENDIIIPSPANRYVVYKLRKAVEIVVSHEERHLNQALEIKDLFQDN
jgi:uncharacterized damage-inducible protein DinB